MIFGHLANYEENAEEMIAILLRTPPVAPTSDEIAGSMNPPGGLSR